jgi:hypothetical protein
MDTKLINQTRKERGRNMIRYIKRNKVSYYYSKLITILDNDRVFTKIENKSHNIKPV